MSTIAVRMVVELMHNSHLTGKLVVGKDPRGRTFEMVNWVYKYQMWYDVNGLTIRVTNRRIERWHEFDRSGVSSGDGSGYVFLPLEKETVAKLKKLERSLYPIRQRYLLRKRYPMFSRK